MREPKAKKAIWNESLNIGQGKDRQVPVQDKKTTWNKISKLTESGTGGRQPNMSAR